MKKILLYIIILLMVTFCTPKESPIMYGMEKCQYCQMAIVDQKFGSEVVTLKGKVYKFDATECLINYVRSNNIDWKDLSMVLTNTLDKPGELITVEHCYFLQSENMPSPMGMFINPISKKQLALEYQSSQNGNIYSWDEVKDVVKAGY